MSNILTRLRHRRTGIDDKPAAQAPEPGPRTRFGAWLGRPMTSFHLIIAVATLLTLLGLTMVLSASGVYSYDQDGSPWVVFAKQVLWTIVGLVAFYVALRMPVQMMRSLAFVDRLVVAVLRNVNKTPLFTFEERVSLIKAAIADEDRIDVHSFDGLLVDFARSVKANLLIRGLRAVSDFEYEYQMALMNRHLSPGLETVFMVPSVETTYVSSSLVREVARFGGDVEGLVHPAVADALRRKVAPA
jgi:pantetheine-phosphate adenylyltransferase